MRLIDADALRTALADCYKIIPDELIRMNGWNSAISRVAHLIGEQPTVSEWIPITERLPEQGKCVLIAYDGGGVAEGMMTTDDGGNAVFTQFRWSACINADDVLAWMPLPERYEP